MRKTLAVILSALMVLSILALGISVNAAEGTAIKTAADFAAMAADGKYYLDADIVITAPYSQKFTGVLDGNGHTVTVSCPMFSVCDGQIKNLTVNGTITANDGLATAAIAVRTVNGMYAENVTTNVNITLTGDKRGMYAAGFLATDNFVVADNTEYYNGAQEANNTNAISAFIKCKNTGDIIINATVPEGNDATTASTMKPRAAGIAAVVEGIYCIECENTGDIRIPHIDLIPDGEGYKNNNVTSAIAGGLVARSGLVAGVSPAEFYSCKNSGEVEAYGNAGGIDSYLGTSGNTATYKLYGCVNTGKVTSANQCGGIICYEYGQSAQFADIEYCLNTGDLYYGDTDGGNYAGPFVGYTNTTSTVLLANISTGKINEIGGGYKAFAHSFIGCSSANPINYYCYFNVFYDPDSHITMFSMCADAADEKNYGNRHTIQEGVDADMVTVLKTLDTVKSGEIAYTLNDKFIEDNDGTLKDTAEWRAITKEDGTTVVSGTYDYEYVWHQAIGTDEVPTVENKANTFVDFKDGKYVNVAALPTEEETTKAATEPAKTEPVVTEPVATDPVNTEASADDPVVTDPAATEKTADAKSGCGSVVGMGVALVAILGSAFVAKKKF